MAMRMECNANFVLDVRLHFCTIDRVALGASRNKETLPSRDQTFDPLAEPRDCAPRLHL